MEENFPFEFERNRMVSEQIERRGLHESCLLAAMRSIPRHSFVPNDLSRNAYRDEPLPIGFNQTISQPYIAALMTSLAGLTGVEKVLEIGTGSGYQAALLGKMAGKVISIELIPELAERAKSVLGELGILNVEIHTGDGSAGFPLGAPYQAILVTAAAPSAPQVLLEQLADGGKMIIPTGVKGAQVLQVWQRVSGRFESENIIPVAFVPLLGIYGWKEFK